MELAANKIYTKPARSILHKQPKIGESFLEEESKHIYGSPETACNETGACSQVAELVRERDEAIKREEAALDRLKLQEVMNNKHVQELRAQIRKLTAENQRVCKPPSSVNSFIGRNEKKTKDGKSKEVRELSKAIEALKNEKKALLSRINELSQFVQVASNLKQQAVSECREKNEVIFNLRRESAFAQQIKLEEMNRRHQAEAELDSIHTYLDYTFRMKRQGMRNKAVQTATSFPLKQSVSAIRNNIFSCTTMQESQKKKQGVSPEERAREDASYHAMKSAASLWRTKLIEHQFQKQSKEMKKRFNHSASLSGRCKHSELPSFSRSKTFLKSFDLYSVEDCIVNGNTLKETARKNGKDYQLNANTISPSQLHSSHFKQQDGHNKDKPELLPPPPPPPPPPISTKGNQPSHKFAQHSGTFVPAAAIYNSRMINEGQD